MYPNPTDCFGDFVIGAIDDFRGPGNSPIHRILVSVFRQHQLSTQLIMSSQCILDICRFEPASRRSWKRGILQFLDRRIRLYVVLNSSDRRLDLRRIASGPAASTS